MAGTATDTTAVFRGAAMLDHSRDPSTVSGASPASGPGRPLLVLIDGHALARRAYHAFDATRTRQGAQLSVTRTGEPVQAVHGFTSMLFKVLNERRPEYLIVAFDAPARTFRHDRFDGYKAQRLSAPADFHQQLARIRTILDAFNIPMKELPGWEADDILGTLSLQASDAGVDTIIVTGDGDTMQLVGPGVRVLYPGSRALTDATLFDEAAVKEKYGVGPALIADLKGLKGDTSDNIPGIPGVGDKTALKLLEEFGTLESVLENAALVKPARMQELVLKHADLARQSKDLAIIDRHAPIELDLEAARFGQFDRERVLDVLRELEFTSLVPRIPAPAGSAGGPPAPVPSAPSVATTPADNAQLGLDLDGTFLAPAGGNGKGGDVRYEIVTTRAALTALRDQLATPRGFAFDTETTSQHEMEARLVGISVSFAPYEGYYLPIGHRDGSPQLSLDEVQDALRPVFADPAIPKVGHNAKYDMIVLANHGMPVQGVAFDTMIAAYLLGEKSIGLKELAFRRLGVEMTPITDLIGAGGPKKQITMDAVPVAAAAPYAAADADLTWRLRHLLEAELHQRDERLWTLFTGVEMPLVPVLVDLERTGIALEPEVLRQLSRELHTRLVEIELKIYDAVGHQFNINSPVQLGKILFEELHLPGGRKTKTGYSTDAQVLEYLRGAHDVVDLVLEYRQLSKLKSTYADTLPEQINPTTGRVHTNLNQTIAATGRLSSVNPNLQNIPVRTELGRKVRTAFVPDAAGSAGPAVLMSADYSQIELRILAHLSHDPRLLTAFANDEDIHAATAADVFGVPQPEVSSAMRRIAKCVATGTLVFTDRGLVPIDTLGAAAEDTFAPVRLTVSHEGEARSATEFYNGGRQQTVRVRTELGFSLEATPNHLVKVVTPSGEYGWRALGQLHEKDWVAIAVGSAVYGEDGGIRVAYERRQTVRGLDMPDRLDGSVARFLGYVAGAGYLNGRISSPTLTVWAESHEVIEDLDSLSREIFHRPPTHLPRKTGAQLRWYNSRIREFLIAMRLAARGSDDSEKAVPEVIMQAGRESVVQFLRGLFEGGGEIVANTVAFSTRSPELARQVQLLLLGAGVVAAVRPHTARARRGAFYDVRLHGKESLRRFLDRVGFVSEGKQAQLAALVESSGRLRDWTVPHQAGRIHRMFPKLTGTLRERLQTLVHRRNFDASYSPAVSARIIRRILREYPQPHDPDYLGMAEAALAPVFFDAVTAIEPSEAEVRDLSVPDVHAYTANGFISHNTVNFGVVYGLSGFGLAERVPELSRSEADKFIKAYFERYHGVQEYLATTKMFAREHGYVEAITGRRRYIPEIHAPNANLRNAAERMAVNMPVQGLAADIIKIAMVRLHDEMQRRGLQSRVLLQVHDELLFEVPPHELDLMRELAPRVMSEAMQLDVPLKVDVKVGSNWGELERVDEQEAEILLAGFGDLG